MTKPHILVVDDDDALRHTLVHILKTHSFQVTPAANVCEALKHIHTTQFDVLLSDLHMPGPSDGLTVISAMRHYNPKAVNMLLSSYPALGPAAEALIQQADEILVKPIHVAALVQSIRQRLAIGAPAPRIVESVAVILNRATQAIIDDWYSRVENDRQIMSVPLSQASRCAHLPQLCRDLIHRLLTTKPLGTRELRSEGACQHGWLRRKQGYSADMLVEESRELQVSIFQALQNNLAHIDFSVLLTDVMTIADEVDSQLSQAMKCYLAEPQNAPALA